MMESLLQHPALLGLLAGLVTWIFTSLGAAAIFLQRAFSQRFLDIMLGLAAGIMLAASVWSLILPALELAQEKWAFWRFVPVSVGFLAGALSLRLINLLLPHIHPAINREEGLGASKLSRHTLLILAITLHNIPEALAVGVAFGAAAIDPELGHSGAILLMFGIGLQNLPEGLAVSAPLVREGMSTGRAFFFGQLSGFVEPVAALIGAIMAATALAILPWALSFAAGAMIFVTVEEVLPEAQGGENANAASMGVMTGFTLMMCLDVAFG